MSYFAQHRAKLRFPLETKEQPGLRLAQIAAAHALSAHFFSRKEPAIVVMPTGSGKSCVMLLTSFMARAERVLIITPSRMVRDQIAEGFRSLRVLKSTGALGASVTGPRVTTIARRVVDTSSWEALRSADVVVTTTQSASPVIEGVAVPPEDLFDLVLCDEAHHTPAPSWKALLDQFCLARSALFTATPFRRDAKVLHGRIIFEYPLVRARDDGVFGRIRYKPVEPATGADPDVALAHAVQAQVAEDRKKGLRHAVLVRTARKERAIHLEEVYAKNTSMKLKAVLGSHSVRHLNATVKALREGRLDGVVCVDMLGEGFDLPNLKIAALHSPHKSLAVTLQFIGRFARTNAPDAGAATFFAVPSEIEIEAHRLYVPGAEWNEIVEEASRSRIEAERESREVLETFTPAAVEHPSADATGDGEIPLSVLAPYFHVKVLDVPDGVDLDRPLNLPIGGDVLICRKSAEHRALIYLTRRTARCRWSRDDRLTNVNYELFVLFYDEKTRLLFICSSRRETAIYDSIVESVAVGEARRLCADEVNRVLRGIEHAVFFSVGLRSRSGFGGESYRMITGRSADKVIQKTDGRLYNRGHCFGRGDDGRQTVTIGFSSASKVWANQRGGLAELFGWCRAIGKKIVDTRAVRTSSGLDHVPLPRRLTAFPQHVIAGDWNEEVYRRDGMHLIVPTAMGNSEYPLTDLSIGVDWVSKAEVAFTIRGDSFQIPVTYRLDRMRYFAVSKTHEAIRCGTTDDHPQPTLSDFLNEFPPCFFTADVQRIQGAEISTAPEDPDQMFDTSLIEEVDWVAARVDPLREKPGKGRGRSVFEWLEERLMGSSAEVIFNDDGAGEVADFIAITSPENGTTDVQLFHCKAAARRPVPGDRVADLYEVVGQAVKSARFVSAVTHQRRRDDISRRRCQSSFVRGGRQCRDGRRSKTSRKLADSCWPSRPRAGTFAAGRALMASTGARCRPGVSIWPGGARRRPDSAGDGGGPRASHR
jgi:superfamily II DNA or RNA helicase